MSYFSHQAQDPFDSYLIEGDDDDSSECQSSSEDEIDVLLHGTTKQKKKLKLLRNMPENLSSLGQQKDSSSEDEFEREMNAELNEHISCLEQERVSTQKKADLVPVSSHRLKGEATVSNERKEVYYNDVYFDSDEEDDSGKTSQHAVLSNDDLLYDPTMDDKDQTWVDRQRRKHGTIPKAQSGKKGRKATPKPTSDALLDCPACLTTVCIDCQRHETYKNQYRAMFVMNCIVDNSEKLQCPEQPSKKKKKNQPNMSSLSSTEATTSSSDLFNPVRCSECNTVVAVVDEDEVYHFFNVLASHT